MFVRIYVNKEISFTKTRISVAVELNYYLKVYSLEKAKCRLKRIAA
jgi:hypothetical protein